jgi:beta-1,2-mannobiose phosphorylase / 1,2-beta-oligomannan phosphorylase
MHSWKKKRLLSPVDLPPSTDGFRVLGVFNPAAALHGGMVVLIARVAEQALAERPNFTPLPRYDAQGQQTIDWIANDDLDYLDRRLARKRSTGAARLTSASHLRVVYLDLNNQIHRLGPTIVPQGQSEEFGIEDPRITPLDGRYYITYVAVSRHGVSTALMSTADFESFDRHGIIFPTENKDVVLLPERVAGQYVALHRPVSAMPFTGPEMWIARSPDLKHWGEHQPLYRGQSAWESGRVGAGAPADSHGPRLARNLSRQPSPLCRGRHRRLLRRRHAARSRRPRAHPTACPRTPT